MKKSRFVLSAAVATFGLFSQAYAYTVDSFLFSSNTGNSGEVTETAALESFLKADVTFDYKLNQGDAGFNITFDTINNNYFVDVNPDEPGYFLLKFGAPQGLNDTFYFKNIAELTKLVFTADQVNYLIGGGENCGFRSTSACNIGRLSHYTLFDGGGGTTTTEIPEPVSLALVGLGLVAVGIARRRKS